MKKHANVLPFFLLGIGIVFFFLLSFFFIQSPSSSSFSIFGCENVDRSTYAIDSRVFSDLPTPPACLTSVARAFEHHWFSDAFFFSPDYYLQPEFYPSFFTDGLSKWNTPVASQYGAVGFGAFPHVQTLRASPGSTTPVRVFFHSGFGVRSYQGVRLTAITEIPEDADEVIVSFDSSSQSGFLLGPSFPKFSPNWVVPVDMNVYVSPTVPFHRIVVSIDTIPLEGSVSSALAESSPGTYYQSTDFIGSRTAFTLIVIPE